MPDFLNPLNWPGMAGEWLLDRGGEAALAAVVAAIAWFIDGVFGGLADIATSILGFFWDAAEPNLSEVLGSAGSEGTPYGLMVLLAAPLLVVFLLAGVIQGALKGDAAGMLRMGFLRLPGAVLAMTVTIAIADVLIRATDEASRVLMAPFAEDMNQIAQALGAVSTVGLAGGPAGLVLMGLFGVLALLGAVAVLALLFVRAGLIYIVVALSPLIYAASVWESMRGGVAKLAHLGFALIVSKLAIAVALGISAAALTATLPAEALTVSEITPPEGAGNGSSAAQTLGLVVAAMAMFAIATFMPFVVMRLLPITEAALVAQGVASAPMRGTQQAYYLTSMASRWPGRGGGGTGDVGGSGGNGPGGSGNSGGGAALGAATLAATATATAAHRGAEAGLQTARDSSERHESSTGLRRPAPDQRTPTRPPQGARPVPNQPNPTRPPQGARPVPNQPTAPPPVAGLAEPAPQSPSNAPAPPHAGQARAPLRDEGRYLSPDEASKPAQDPTPRVTTPLPPTWGTLRGPSSQRGPAQR